MLILRRFQDFKLNLPAKAVGSGIEYSLKDPKGSVKLQVVGTSGSTVTLKHSQAPAAIGIFTLEAKKGGSVVFTVPEPVVFLFNAWAKEDPVFIDPALSKGEFGPDTEEHVLNELGVQFQGSDTSYDFSPWAYNQFDLSPLRVILKLMSELSLQQRANPTLVSRYATVQSQEVLRGRWDGNYKDGKEPVSSSICQIVGRQFD